ncbi:uracil-DNA glycosylase [Paeniglutamicibacter gangotriensis]|uniref:Uracil-DNA glycosylase n=1 Tax=Paeniglutamicibacter gangotriensis TaxID=254787 RepID=A0A5B0EM90_9MICC|nr:uracil-DNA glycosylase [Paeniglutamicibacter gangotriensis]KAA0979031.1 uracil-DNA glycosylase [Paeniglutamicibacter gangotriensis]
MDTHETPLFEFAAPQAQPAPFPFATGLNDAVAGGFIAPDWALALEPVQGVLVDLARDLEARRAAGEHILPEPGNILRAFSRPLAEARVLVMGQDPYPTPGHSMGLSFAALPQVQPLPRSLKNIYTELHQDTGLPVPGHGDLSAWANQGVVLLNRVLTVAAGDAGSHRKLGWEAITDAAIAALAARGGPLVAILWGKDAQALAPALDSIPIIASAHPSPLSARRGFFGSKPFTRANDLLVAQGGNPIDWALPLARRRG